MLPCPWCVLGVPHEHAPEQEVARALQLAKKNLAQGRITELQYGMVRCAAAEVLLQTHVASNPDEAMSFVAGMEQAAFCVWSASGDTSSSSGPPPPPPLSVPPLSFARHAHFLAAGSGSTAVPSLSEQRDVRQGLAGKSLPCAPSTFSSSGTAAGSQAMHSATRAASSASAWLAPGTGRSVVGEGASPTEPTLAIVPHQPGQASGSASSAGLTRERWVWQVETGKGRKRKWTTVSDDLAAILEHAYANNLDSCTWNWEGWVYYYEMATMTQCSPGESGTERAIRRIPYHEVYGDV